MNNNQCKNCQYFLQHYTLTRRRLIRVHCGHCTFSKVKRKQPDTIACENFLPSPPQQEAFASKEYLSKELLEYVLSLELLPEIAELPEQSAKG